MAVFRVAADTSNAVNAIGNYIKALDGMNDRLKEVTTTSVKVNAAGNLLSTRFKALAEDGSKVTGVMKNKKNGLVDIQLQYEKTNAAAAAYNKQLEDQQKLLKDFKQSFENVSRALQYYVAYKGFNILTDQIKGGFNAAKDLQIQLSLIRTISQDSQQSFSKWGRDLQGVSDKLGMDLKDVSKAAYDAISNQAVKGGAVAPFLADVGEFARVTGSTLTDSVNLFSSAINAYGMSSADAERIAAVFFKTIDEGRVVTSEMANTFGRVAILGKGLGVTFEEINAMLAIMTKQGLKTEDALTLITNLLIKLEKPTEATSKLFKEWGVNTGEQAISTLKFAGVMREIISQVQQGNQEFSQLFDEIRGRKAVGAIANDLAGFDKFLGKINDTKNVIEEYKKAVEIRGESPADKMQKEFNKLKNAFTIGVGQDLIKLTVNAVEFAKSLDRITGGAGTTTSAGNKLIAMFVLGTGSVIGFRVALTTMNAALTAVGVTSTRVVPLLAALSAVGIAFAAVKGLDLGNSLTSRSTGVDDIAEAAAKMREAEAKATANEKTGGRDSLDVLGDKITRSFEKAFKAVAEVSKRINKELDEIKERSKKASEALSVAFQGYTDSSKNYINGLKKEISEATREIDKSRDSMLKFKDLLDGLSFGTKMKYATDEQKEQLTEQKIKELREQAAADFKAGNADEGRRKLVQAAGLIRDNFERVQDRNVEAYRDRVARGEEAPGALDAKGRAIYGVDVSPLEARLNALKREQNDLEEAYQGKQQKTIGNSQKQLAIEEERLRKMNQAFKAFNDLDFLKADGSVKDEFLQKGTNKPDNVKILKAFGEKSQALIDLAPDVQSRIQLEGLVFDKKRAIYDQMKKIEEQGNLETARKKIENDEKFRKDAVAGEKKARTEAAGQAKTIIDNLSSQSEVFKQALDTLSPIVGVRRRGLDGSALDGENRYLTPFNSDEDNQKLATHNKLITDLKQRTQEYNAAIAALRVNAQSNIVGGVPIPRDEDIARVRELGLSVTQLIAAASRNATGENATLYLQGLQKNTTGLEQDAVLRKWLDDLQGASKKVQSSTQAEKMIDQITKRPEDTLRDLNKEFPELRIGVNQFSEDFKKAFEKMSDSIDPVLNKLERLNLLQGGTSKVSSVIGEDGSASYFADGGVVGFPGQPKGADRYPIWAAKDEFIVNAESSRAFRPMLEAINRNRSPRYYSEGGAVGGDTNIGDINITVQGGASPTQTARAVGQQLERELRRRSITFDPKRRR